MKLTFEPMTPDESGRCYGCRGPATTHIGLHRPAGPVIAWEKVCSSEECAAMATDWFRRLYGAVFGQREESR